MITGIDDDDDDDDERVIVSKASESSVRKAVKFNEALVTVELHNACIPFLE
jgi:hypothetical protein